MKTWCQITSRSSSPQAGMWMITQGPHVLKATGGWWWWSRCSLSHLVCPLGKGEGRRVKELLPGHINSFPHHPNRLSLPSPSTGCQRSHRRAHRVNVFVHSDRVSEMRRGVSSIMRHLSSYVLFSYKKNKILFLKIDTHICVIFELHKWFNVFRSLCIMLKCKLLLIKRNTWFKMMHLGADWPVNN